MALFPSMRQTRSNYRYVPLGVVIPKDKEDIIEAVKICRQYNVPIVGRGGATGLAGQTVNSGIVIDFSKYYNKILEINEKEKWARAQPGVVLDALNKRLEDKGLIVGPDPATHGQCTIGGMLGNNACGIHAQMAGKMEENTLELEVLTYRGEVLTLKERGPKEVQEIIEKGGGKAKIYSSLLSLRDRYENLIRDRYPKIPRRVSGYNLNELLEENRLQSCQGPGGERRNFGDDSGSENKSLRKAKTQGPYARGLQEYL